MGLLSSHGVSVEVYESLFVPLGIRGTLKLPSSFRGSLTEFR